MSSPAAAVWHDVSSTAAFELLATVFDLHMMDTPMLAICVHAYSTPSPLVYTTMSRKRFQHFLCGMLRPVINGRGCAPTLYAINGKLIPSRSLSALRRRFWTSTASGCSGSRRSAALWITCLYEAKNAAQSGQ